MLQFTKQKFVALRSPSDDKRKPPITRVYTRRQRAREATTLGRQQQGAQHPGGCKPHNSHDPPKGGSGLRRCESGGMTLGAETHSLGLGSATQEDATGGERVQPLESNSIRSEAVTNEDSHNHFD